MKPTGKKLLESEEWSSILHGSPPRYRQVASKLDSGDITALVDYLSSAPPLEKTAVLGLLQAACVENLPFIEDQKKQLVIDLKSLLVGYPDSISQKAFMLMVHFDSTLAEQFIVESVDLGEIPDSGFLRYLMDLSRVKSIRAMDRIVEYSKRTDEKGGIARSFLKSRGIISESEISDLALKWRASKSVKYLGELYEYYIQHQGGKPVTKVLNLLGSWNRHAHREYWFDTIEGPSLFLEVDEQGNLRGSKIK